MTKMFDVFFLVFGLIVAGFITIMLLRGLGACDLTDRSSLAYHNVSLYRVVCGSGLVFDR